jgi:drug/metabolite transporter (DMT)-like permease
MSGRAPASTSGRHASPGAPRASGAMRSLGLMFVSTFFFASMHGSIRYLSDAIHPFEIAFFRSLFALVVVVPWFYREGFGLLRT